jgi:RNA polymerase sigma-70 factor (ECF subfamily)
MTTTLAATDFSHWATLVQQVIDEDVQGVETLYRELQGFHRHFQRKLGRTQGDDAYHDLILDLTRQIRRGCLREPERLLGYVRAVAQRKEALCIRTAAFCRNKEVDVDTAFGLASPNNDPERTTIRHEYVDIARRILLALPTRDREILLRFYVRGEHPDQIQQELSLTPTQFRVVKSRAKQRFTSMCQARLEGRKPSRASQTGEAEPSLQRRTAF